MDLRDELAPMVCIPGRAQIAPMMLRPGEWLLTRSPAGECQAGGDVDDLLSHLGSLAARGPGPAVYAVPCAAIPQGLGPAVLHFRDAAGSVIYCAEDQISRRAARVVSAVLNQAGMLAPISGAAYDSVIFSRVPHHLLAGLLHPGFAELTAPARLRVFVCANLLGADLADALGRLCTVQVRRLPSVSAAGAQDAAGRPLLGPGNQADARPGRDPAGQAQARP